MEGKITLEKGRMLVKLAREIVESYFEGKEVKFPDDDFLKEKRGLFVTIHTYPEKELRGCIGFPLPAFQIKDALKEAALSAAFSDPRFPPLKKEELEKVVFEVSVLTLPEEIKFSSPQDLLNKIVPFEDGLILEYGFHKGLFLPQVWEQLPSKEQFLSQLCFKAGIFDAECWKKKGVKLYKFKAQIFEEIKPKGEVVEVKGVGKKC